MKKLIVFASAFSIVLLLSACSASQPVTDKEPMTDHTYIYVNDPISLTSLLLNAPGVYVDEAGLNTRVYIRGRKPLFVVDGIQVGYNYQDVLIMVDVNSIAAVEILKSPSETFMYGGRGTNGVIVIHTGSYEPEE